MVFVKNTKRYMFLVIVFKLRIQNPKFLKKTALRETGSKYKILINNVFKLCKILFTEMQMFI